MNKDRNLSAKVKALIRLLRSRAADLALKSEGCDSQKAWWQDGHAFGLSWAADHLASLVAEAEEEK